uniref:WAP domain-containing protein n=1 Tax=Caenorhabditis tropicalis TaxID=1561998 RepID=A0A1I7UJL1_9PELO
MTSSENIWPVRHVSTVSSLFLRRLGRNSQADTRPSPTPNGYGRYARAGTPQSCPDNSACLYTGNDNGFICCRVQLGSGKA